MINYIRGDATAPQGEGQKVIAHVCNDLGAWGAGFVLAVSKRWPGPERRYRSQESILGDVQFVPVSTDLCVANMVAQRGFPSQMRRCALDYSALEMCLSNVAKFAKALDASVHMPRIGCGIAGGEWWAVERLIKDTLSAIDVSVYDLP